MSHPIYTGIANKLTADAGPPTGGISTLTGGRMYADKLPTDVQLPALRYAFLTNMPHQRLASGAHVSADIQFDVYAPSGGDATAWPIDAAINRIFDRQNITATGFSRVAVVCVAKGTPFEEPGYYRIRSVYRFFGTAE